MTAEEREQILQMVANGRVTAAEAALLMEALDDGGDEPAVAGDDEMLPSPEAASTASADDPAPQTPDDFDRLRRRYRWLGYLPLVVGLPLLLLSASWLHSTFVNDHFFRFLLAWIPFWLSVLLVWLGANSQRMPWVFVNVKQEPGEFPRRIFLGFPLPIRLVGWGLRLARNWIEIPGLKRTSLDEIFLALEQALRSDTPLMVRVEEDEEVEVFIG